MKKLIAIVSVLAVGAALTAGMAYAKNGNARIRVIHASPDAPAVDVLVNDSLRLFTGAPFEGVTGYETVPAGVYNAKVVPMGGDPASNVIDVDVNLLYNRDYTVVAVGDLAAIEPLALIDDNGLVPQKYAKVRFLHASPDAPEVDIKVVNGPYLFQSVEFKEVGDYVMLPKGRYGFEVQLSSNGAVALSLENVRLRGGRTYTLVATGFALGGSPGLNAVLSEDSARKGNLRGNDDEYDED